MLTGVYSQAKMQTYMHVLACTYATHESNVGVWVRGWGRRGRRCRRGLVVRSRR